MDPKYAGVLSVIFYVGRYEQLNDAHDANDAQERVENESRINGDILQFDVNDSIHNGTWKTLAVYEWVTLTLRQAHGSPRDRVRVSRGTGPTLWDTEPVLEDGWPVLGDGAPLLWDGGPVLREGRTIMRDSGPFLRDSGPIMRDSNPIPRDIGPVSKDTLGAAASAGLPLIMKVNDCSFVNAPLLLALVAELRNHLETQANASTDSVLQLYGSIITNGKPKRRASSTFYVPTSVWHPAKWGFDYLSGNGYLLTVATIDRLLELHYNCFRTVLWIEDVFITGFLADMLNLKLVHDSRFYTGDEDPSKPPKKNLYGKFVVVAEIPFADLPNTSTHVGPHVDAKHAMDTNEGVAGCGESKQRMPSDSRKDPLCAFFRNIDLPNHPNESCYLDNFTDSYTYR